MSNPFNPFQTRSALRFPPEARGYAFRMSGRRIFCSLLGKHLLSGVVFLFQPVLKTLMILK